ncbi:hypothetical protein ACEUD4_08960 [Aeromonas media]|uniref:hypothetical protein n=1 Tax=Aeromonas media TaxID=651 RepID=UPI0038D17347
MWIDAGDRRIRPGVEALPFLVTPPITRIEASPCDWRTWGRGCLRIVNRYSG